MSWLPFAIICMLLTVLKTFLAKGLLRKLEPSVFVFMDLGFSCLFLLPFVYFVDLSGITFKYFVVFLMVMLPGLISLTYLSKATKHGEVSEVAPLLLLVPALSALVSPFILDESVSEIGWLGIFTVLFGGYLIKLEDLSKPFSPFIALRNESAMKFVLVAIIISVFSVNLQKWLVLETDPLTTLMLSNYFLLFLASPVAIKVASRSPVGHLSRVLRSHWYWFLLLGAVTSSSGACMFAAFSHGGQVAYVLTVKWMSVILIAVFGMIAMKESVRLPKIMGVLCMVIGGVLLTQI